MSPVAWCKAGPDVVDVEGRPGMSTTPEYGEEKVISERERRIEERSDGVFRAEDTEEEQEVGERAHEERELQTIEPQDNEAHAPGQICVRCGQLITASQDVRRLPDGRWVHEWCPGPTGAPGQTVK
jgi:hypothetical protein